MKTQIPVNKPKTKDRFEDVSFVKDMSKIQLQVYIQRMTRNIWALSSQLEGRRPDASKVLDMITDGKRWTNKDLDDRYIYGSYSSEYIIRFDSKTKEFTIMDNEFNKVEPTIQGVTRTDNRNAKAQEKA